MQSVLSPVSFEEFYKSMSLVRYPFRERTAERENTTELFIKPLDYSYLHDDLSSNHSVIVCGNRGSGKTITLLDLKREMHHDKIFCLIDHFENVATENNQLDFYSLILQNLTKNILIFISNNQNCLKKVSYDDKVLLSFLIMKYGDSITDNQLYSKLEEVQLSLIKRLLNKISTPLTALLNYGTTTVTNFGNELLTQHFGAYLPDISEGTVKRIFPDIQFPVENQFKGVPISYSLLDSALKMIVRITGNVPTVFIDKLDEDIRFENDAELVSTFFKDLICDSNLLLNQSIQLVISVWKIPFQNLSTIFRESKVPVYYLQWNRTQLEIVLNHRLSVYSNNQITNYRDLLDTDVSDSDLNDLYELSNSNPRDLWGIFDAIFNAQYSIDSSSHVIRKEAIIKGLRKFVECFQFYEYYPRKRNAQKNTNDIYSYINYLLKLPKVTEFTNGELRDAASTGGSTTNYITGMMNIGLVKKTDRKRVGGAVIYQINDPKVSYAIFHEIDIQHS